MAAGRRRAARRRLGLQPVHTHAARLAGAGDTVALLFAGRLLAGLSSGAMFGAGTAWLRELGPDRRARPETVVARPAAAAAPGLSEHGRARFRRVVVPSAPWVFAAPAIAFALLPAVVGADHATDGTAFVAAVTALTAFSGVLVQPLARRLEHRAGPPACSCSQPGSRSRR